MPSSSCTVSLVVLLLVGAAASTCAVAAGTSTLKVAVLSSASIETGDHGGGRTANQSPTVRLQRLAARELRRYLRHAASENACIDIDIDVDVDLHAGDHRSTTQCAAASDNHDDTHSIVVSCSQCSTMTWQFTPTLCALCWYAPDCGCSTPRQQQCRYFCSAPMHTSRRCVEHVVKRARAAVPISFKCPP